MFYKQNVFLNKINSNVSTQASGIYFALKKTKQGLSSQKLIIKK